MRFRLAHAGLDTAPILANLERQAVLWGEYGTRRIIQDSPHSETSDIWVRCHPWNPALENEDFKRPHYPEFWSAWDRLPTIQPVVRSLMVQHHGTHLGNILITKIPPSGKVATHTDEGWAVEYFDRKFYVVLQGNARCINHCEDEEVVMRTGEIWEFNNRLPHGVVNCGSTDRISLIVTLRAEQ